MLVFDDSPGTTKGTKFYVLHIFGQMWLFDHWPTHKCNRALRRAYLVTGRQECLRATAQSYRDEDVLLRSSALLHWASHR